MIGNAETDATGVRAEFDFRFLAAAMFNYVPERFLGNSKQTQGHILGDIERRFARSEMNFNPVLLTIFSAKPMESRHQPHMLQLAGVELMREGVNVRGHFLSPSEQLQNASPFLHFGWRQFLPKLSKADAEERQALAEIIMEFPGNARAFFFLGTDQAPAQLMEGFF